MTLVIGAPFGAVINTVRGDTHSQSNQLNIYAKNIISLSEIDSQIHLCAVCIFLESIAE